MGGTESGAGYTVHLSFNLPDCCLPPGLSLPDNVMSLLLREVERENHNNRRRKKWHELTFYLFTKYSLCSINTADTPFRNVVLRPLSALVCIWDFWALYLQTVAGPKSSLLYQKYYKVQHHRLICLGGQNDKVGRGDLQSEFTLFEWVNISIIFSS